MEGWSKMIAEYTRNELDDFEAVVISEEDSGDSLAIMVSLSEPTVQDIDSGTAGYCVVVNGGATYYGGVLDVQSIEGGLQIAFSHDACSVLGVDGVVDIRLSSNNSELIIERIREIIQ